MPVDLDDGCIDHRVFHVRLVAQGVEYPFEYIGLNPTTEAPEGAVPVPELRRQVTPRGIRSYNPQNSFKEKPRVTLGLACLSAALFLLLLCATRSFLWTRSAWVRILGAFTIFWLFTWLSPQIYYQYYRMVIEDLPQQLVIGSPPSPYEALQLLLFQGPHSLSAHGRGLLGWSLFVMSFVKLPSVPRRNPGK